MNLLNRIIGNSSNKDNESKRINWIELTSLLQLDPLITLSHHIPVAIFKHSTRCSVSRMALKQFEKKYSLGEEQTRPYFLDLLNYRSISSAIAERFDVVHESPQLLLIKNGKVIYNVSHSAIDAADLKRKINV